MSTTGELVGCAELLDPHRQRTLTERLVAGGDETRDRILRSWVWVDYAELLLPGLLVAWLCGERVPDLSAGNTLARIGPAGFEEVVEDRRRQVAAPDGAGDALDEGLRRAIDGHLGPIVRGATAITRVGGRTIWGSIAASLVDRVPPLVRARGGRVTSGELAAILRRRPELAGRGEFVEVDGDPARFVFHRSTCCLWFRLEPGRMCRGCVMESRSALVEAVVAGEGDRREEGA